MKLLLAAFLSLPLLADSTAGIQWTPPSTWKAQAQRPMRAATYEVPGVGGEEAGECAVFYFGQGQGGDVQANVDRWIAQFEGTAKKPAPKTEQIGGVKVTTLEHSGTYLSGGPMSPVKTPKPNYRMLGAIAEAPQGNVFFKLTAPARTAAAHAAAFRKMIESIKR